MSIYSHVVWILGFFDHLAIIVMGHKNGKLLDACQVSATCACILEFAPDVGVSIFEEHFCPTTLFAENFNVSFWKRFSLAVHFELSKFLVDLDLEQR